MRPTEQEQDRAPIFAEVLGAEWNDLGEIIRRHYFLRPFSRDRITVHGRMDEIAHSRIAKLLIPMARIVGALVPWQGRDVPIEVHYSARPDSATLHWDRVFHFPGRSDFHFRSYMQQTGPGEVVEFVRFGVGMRLAVTAENGALVFRGRGYLWRLFGLNLPLPLGLLLGRAYVEERPADADHFTMRMTLTHPLFGELFRYSGRFSLGESSAPVALGSLPR